MNADKTENILRNLDEVVVITDTKGKISYTSPNANNIFDKNDMIHTGENIVGIIYSDDSEFFQKKFQSVIDKPDASETFTCRRKDYDKSHRWYQIKFKNLNDDPEVNGILGVFLDISDQKILEDNEKKLNAIFNSSRDLMCLIAVEPDTYYYAAINVAYAFGMKAVNKDIDIEKVVGRKIIDIYKELYFSDEYNQRVFDIYEKCIETGEPVITIDEIKSPSSHIILNSVYTPVMDDFKNCRYILYSGHNVTELKQAENELKKKNEEHQEINQKLKRSIDEIQIINAELNISKEKAEQSNKLKIEFLNNLSHEIRTPMNGILGFSEMLEDYNLEYEKRVYYSKLIKKSGNQLLKIIDDILEISALETKQITKNEEAFCLNELLASLYCEFNTKSEELNIPLHIKKELKDQQSWILTDKSKLSKILSNLLQNAFKFTQKGSVEIGYTVKEPNLVLYIKDTGIGIETKSQDLIFERFSQENKEIANKSGGLGLGLSISREYAKFLGGNITLKSVKGKGSTFFITIPYRPIQKERKRAVDSALVSSNLNGNLTILVAEDEHINYLYIEALLEEVTEKPIKLIHAKNGMEAVDLCNEHKHIDIVLIDIKMPLMNGHDATRLIKTKFPNLPIIAQTSYSTEYDRNLALEYGCDDFISKPLKKDKLFEMINKHVQVK